MSDPTAVRIAGAALRILETEGAAAVSMRRVAQEAGVTAMAIYHHYDNREALLHAVTDADFSRRAEQCGRRAGRGGGRRGSARGGALGARARPVRGGVRVRPAAAAGPSRG